MYGKYLIYSRTRLYLCTRKRQIKKKETQFIRLNLMVSMANEDDHYEHNQLSFALVEQEGSKT